MGNCALASSSEIHGENEYGHESAVMMRCGEDGGTEGSLVHGFGSVCSKPGIKKLNQDAAILYQGYGTEEGEFCGVFDGHGKNGHLVSQMVRNRLPTLLWSRKNANRNSEFEQNNELYDWEQACMDAFRVMDMEIKLQGFDCSCSGTTAVVVIRQGDDLVIANLGDSRAVLGTTAENGGIKAVQLTVDLKPGLPGEAKRIRGCKGRVFAREMEPERQRVWLPDQDVPGLAMSRAFGNFLLKDYGVIALPNITHHKLTPSDQFLVLASDGVWDVLSNNEVAVIVNGSRTKQGAANAVAEAATAVWKKRFPHAKIDDITVVCLFLQKTQPPRTPTRA